MTDQALHGFMRRWGAVALVRAQNGDLGLWDGIPGSQIMEELDRISLGLDAGQAHTARVHLPMFSREVELEPTARRNFKVNDDDILQTTNLSGRLIEKLSWNPKTGETLLIWPGQQHASGRGKSPFDDYVRVVILHQQKLCTFRPFWPSWASKLPGAESMDKADVFDLSYSAQEACEKALRAAGAKDWSFQYNIDNKTLADISGRGWW